MKDSLHELMTEEELEEIAGGNIDENYAFLAEIKKNNLADVPGADNSVDAIKAAFKGNHKAAAQRLKDILIGYGFDSQTKLYFNPYKKNSYYHNGKSVTMKDAIKIMGSSDDTIEF